MGEEEQGNRSRGGGAGDQEQGMRSRGTGTGDEKQERKSRGGGAGEEEQGRRSRGGGAWEADYNRIGPIFTRRIISGYLVKNNYSAILRKFKYFYEITITWSKITLTG